MARKYTVSDKVKRANQERAKKARPSARKSLRELFHEALEPVMAEHAFPRLIKILSDPTTANDTWLRAFEAASDRLGLPRLAQHQIGISNFAINVGELVTAGAGQGVGITGLGWPAMGSTDALCGGGGGALSAQPGDAGPN